MDNTFEYFLQNLDTGIRHDFTFAINNLSNVHVILQTDATRLRYTDEDEITHQYQLRSFPGLPPGQIEVIWDKKKFSKSGKELAVWEHERELIYNEREVKGFAHAVTLQGLLPFSYMQALNGLTRRLAEFEGNLQTQGGHMLFRNASGYSWPQMYLEAVQPVTFIVSDIVPEGTDENGIAQADGSLKLSVVDGSNPYKYSLNAPLANNPDYGDEWHDFPADGIVTGIAAGTYQVGVKDNTGVWHSKTVKVPQQNYEII